MSNRFYLQGLMDLPYAGSAKQILLKHGKWDESNLQSTKDQPLELIIDYESGYSVSEYGEKSVIFRSN